MNIMQQEFDKLVADLPRQILLHLLDRKFREQGIKLFKKQRAELADKIMTTEVDRIAFGPMAGGSKNIKIEFNESDSKWIDGQFEHLLKDLPKIIHDSSEQISSLLYDDLKKSWRGEARRQQRERAAFRRRLQKRWGAGLSMLRMQLTIAREFGDGIARKVIESGESDSPKTFEILIKLHARACQVTDEILCLLEGGFADGAMARWRTLHEITAVAYLIRSHGDELAERYEQHEAIESWRAAHQYQDCHERLGYPPIPAEDLAQLDAEHAALITKYGREFARQQGWAAKHIQKHNPTIADMQQASGIDHLGPHYRMASHNVHANPKGVFFRLGLYDESSILLAGPSNAGLADPGHSAAISLAQVSSTLLDFQYTLDNIVILQIMLDLSDELGTALLATHEQLDADHDHFLRTGESKVDD